APPGTRGFGSPATGIAGAGGSMGQFAVVPAGQLLISNLDWTGALWVLSIFVAMGIPLASFLTGRPAESRNEHSLGSAIRQALGHKSFHFLFWSYAVCGFHTAFITLHLPAFLMDGGLKPSHGATALALIGLFNVAGCYYAGKLGERLSKKALLAWVYFLRAFGILFLIALPPSPMVAYLFAAWMGLFWL